jgi:peptidoglycan-associated lipoprotein
MKKSMYWIGALCVASFILPACHKQSNDVWGEKGSENNTSALWGNSDEISSRGDENILAPREEEFIPLKEEDLQTSIADAAIPQPMITPGEEGSFLPGIDRFQIPAGALAAVFHNVYFNTDDHILRGEDHLQAIERMVAYLKDHPNCYLFVEGHCDERGPEAYNLSLGSRRANYIRSLIVQKGIDLNRVHTISYGKEKPLVSGHSSESWSKNRRAQFRIYQRPS